MSLNNKKTIDPKNKKTMSLKKIKIIATFGIFALSFLSHFAYDLFPNILFTFFFPVNESIWEHMKIIFTSTLLYGIIDYYLLNKNKINYNNFSFQLYFTAFSAIPIYLLIYLPLYHLVGENLFISIALLLIVYTIEQYISYQILKEKDFKILNPLAVPIVIITYLGFIYLTYNPPHTYIFYDTVKEKYGTAEYKQIGINK